MARLGHSSIRAAMIYQHATHDRDQAIAKAFGTFIREANAGNRMREAASCGTYMAQRLLRLGCGLSVEHRKTAPNQHRHKKSGRR
jgi:hypothetical protein